jgi:hypothetical protein
MSYGFGSLDLFRRGASYVDRILKGEKPAAKAELRQEGIERFGVSKSSFDFAWIWAIEETKNHHWYDPLPRSGKKTNPKLKRTLLV